MAQQQAIWSHFVASLKDISKSTTHADESDSSTELSNNHGNNRGNKLKRKARHTREGQLVPQRGTRPLRRSIEHAGYRRDIISQKKPLLDQDGYYFDSDEEIDEEDEDDERVQAAISAAADRDPYATIKIERLLAPLRSITDLPYHPTLSRPFTSNNLSELTHHAGEMVQKERTSLWRIKHLLTQLSGDECWAPCGSVEAAEDVDFFPSTTLSFPKQRANGHSTSNKRHNDYSDPQLEELNHSHTLQPSDDPGNLHNIEATDDRIDHPAGDRMARVQSRSTSKDARKLSALPKVIDAEHASHANRVSDETRAPDSLPDVDGPSGALEPISMDNEVLEGSADGRHSLEEAAPSYKPRRMRTRAQAMEKNDNDASDSTRSMSLDIETEPYVHPYFLIPKVSRPDRNMALPSYEAEETRRILQLYVQKQEEICRRAQVVYEGLLRANRYRRLILKWAKAEAHVGMLRDMSDGEDWYDMEEWGLIAELKKGQDDEEDEAITNAKKTRNRR